MYVKPCPSIAKLKAKKSFNKHKLKISSLFLNLKSYSQYQTMFNEAKNDQVVQGILLKRKCVNKIEKAKNLG